MENTPEKSSILDLLKEFYRIERIEDLGRRVRAFEDFIPRLQGFAESTHDRKLIGDVYEFTRIERESRALYQIPSLLEILVGVRKRVEEFAESISSQTLESFLSCIREFEESLAESRKSAFASFKRLSIVGSQVTRQLIGRRLEREIAPDLVRKLGYELRPNIFPDNAKEIEVDCLGERDLTTAPFGTGRLNKKSVLVVECKTTISKKEINKFSTKANKVKSKYETSADAFQHELEFEAWILSCYGWTEELKALAIKKGIRPFDEDEMMEMLVHHGLQDRRIPICPES